jgi:hypothetical protein
MDDFRLPNLKGRKSFQEIIVKTYVEVGTYWREESKYQLNSSLEQDKTVRDDARWVSRVQTRQVL